MLKTEAIVLYNLMSEVIHYHFCHMLLVTQTHPGRIWEELHKGMKSRRQGSLGATLEADYPILPLYHVFTFFFFFNFGDRERQSMNGGGAEREGDTESETGSRL